MDKGFSLPCYQNFGKTIKLLTWKAVIIVQGKDISLSPLPGPDGMFLNLQVHGNLNSMMQNITYNPIDQDHSYFLCL